MIHTTFIRDPKVIEQHLHFYNGILQFVPSLHGELNTMTAPQLMKIVQAVHVCIYAQ